MRKSARLKTSNTLEKIINEDFAGFNDFNDQEDEELYEKPREKGANSAISPRKTEKLGLQKKLEQSSDEEYYKDNDESEVSDSESNISGAEPLAVKTFAVATPGKKKIKRTGGGYIPSLEQFPGINGNLLTSATEWRQFLIENNSNIKRKNRKYKTIIIDNPKKNCLIQNIAFSSFRTLHPNSNLRMNNKTSLKLKCDNNLTELISFDTLLIDGKIANINTGVSNIFLRFCECQDCKSDAGSIVLFSGSSEVISVLKVKVCNNSGINFVEEIGSIIPPTSESFKSFYISHSILSFSTNRSLYFIDSKKFHNQSNFMIILNESNEIISDLSCHCWRGNNIAVGTLSGQLFVFNTAMQEIFQISVSPGASIFSLDWIDEFTIVIGGNFSKIFSIDLRYPFLIETETSTLATLPKVFWSQTLNSILFADGENHARRLEKSSKSLLHQPIGTFDSMVHDMASSSIHNITASACASGSIHLSWMPDEPGYGFELEKRIFSLSFSEDGSYETILKPEYIKFQIHDTVKLYPSNQACTAVAWCPNDNFPGLLASGFRNGLLILITTDRFFI